MTCARSCASACWLVSWAVAGRDTARMVATPSATPTQSDPVIVVSGDLVALDGTRVECETQAWSLGHDEVTALDGRRFLEQPERPGHVLDGEAVGDGGDDVHVDLGQQVAHDRQVE